MHVADTRWCRIGAESLPCSWIWRGKEAGGRRGKGDGGRRGKRGWQGWRAGGAADAGACFLVAGEDKVENSRYSPCHGRSLSLSPCRALFPRSPFFPSRRGCFLPRAPISPAARCWFPRAPALLVAHGILFRIWRAKSRHMDDIWTPHVYGGRHRPKELRGWTLHPGTAPRLYIVAIATR